MKFQDTGVERLREMLSQLSSTQPTPNSPQPEGEAMHSVPPKGPIKRTKIRRKEKR